MNMDDMNNNNPSDLQGHGKTLDNLLSTRYLELVSRARRLLRHERPGHTLQTSALVHEAYLRMLKLYKVDWKDHSQFLSTTVGVMRRVLVDHARHNKAKKRGGDLQRVEFREDISCSGQSVDIEALDNALKRLAERDPLQASIVEHRYFGGMTIEQTSMALRVSPATIKRKWTIAQAWLYRDLQPV